MKYFLSLFIALTILSSCKEFNENIEDKKEGEEIQAEERESAANKPEVKLHILDGGSILAKKKILFSEGDRYKNETQELASPFYIIQHPNGVLLWDTGLPEGLVGQGKVTPEGDAFEISRDQKIVDQLAALGLTVEDIDMIAFSHVHFDHTGAANNFPKAKWLVQQTEMDFINSDDIKGNAFYAPDSFNKLTDTKILNGDDDVFGDGSVMIKYYPGHTAGHQALYLDLKESGPTMLSGDTFHFQENREDNVVPQFNHDIAESKVSIKAFERFVSEKGAEVIIQHDPEHFKESINKTPLK